MNRKGIFGVVRLGLMAVLLIFLWIALLPDAITPGITTSIASVTGSPNGEMAEFLLRMLPWMFVIVLLVGFTWLASTS